MACENLKEAIENFQNKPTVRTLEKLLYASRGADDCGEWYDFVKDVEDTIREVRLVIKNLLAYRELEREFVKHGAEDMLASLGKIVLDRGSPRVRDTELLKPIIEYAIEDFRKEVEIVYNDARNYVEKLNSSRAGFYEYVGKYVKNLDIEPPVSREEVEKYLREIDEFLPIEKKVFESSNPEEVVRRAERLLEEVEDLFHRLGDPEPELINSFVLKDDPLRELHEKRVILKFDLEKVKHDLDECFKTYEEVLDAMNSSDEHKLYRAQEKLFALSDVCQSIIAEKIRRETGKDIFA